MNSPDPKIHTGNLTALPGKVYDFTEITGSIDARGADTKTAFPKLTTVGGSIDASGADTKTAFPKLVSTNKTDALHAALGAQNLILADGILAKVVSKRGPVMRVIVIGRNKVSYIVTRDGRTAHGGTLAEARADLLVKIGNRDTSPYRSWTAGTKATLEDMIVAYRVITGACAQGVSFFLAETKCPKELTVGYAVELTQGRYGHDSFRNFFAAK